MEELCDNRVIVCDNLYSKRKAEIRVIDVISFRITGDTNFNKKLTGFVSKFAWEIELKVKIAKIADMAVADVMCRNLGFGLEFFRNWFFAWFLTH